jgi:glycosyltransferase involved in cell wall biosynthesis
LVGRVQINIEHKANVSEKSMKDNITVCICTYHRNPMLERLLRNLKLQETAGLFEFSVVVVDNDAAGPAHDTVIGLRTKLDLELKYGIEPEHTIPAARNHALRLARGNYIAIIDDDEFPPQNWLVTLFRAIHTFNVNRAVGPVHPFFEQKPPAWLVKSRICERRVYRTGTILDWPQTRMGNVLLKKDVFDKGHLCFDLKMKTEASDHVFFKQAKEAGYKFVAVEEAPVYECIPTERFEKSYYVKRALIQGHKNCKMHMAQLRGVSKLPMAIKSIVALFIYTITLPFSACLGGHLLVKCLESGGYHLSTLFTMFGIELVKKRDF